MIQEVSCPITPNWKWLRPNPFASVDQTGVGQLMEIAVKKGKSARRGIKLGICGEHGGDPSSVRSSATRLD